MKYLEHYVPIIGYEINHYGPQLWGTTEEYRVEWRSGTAWCVSVDNNYECYDVSSAPSVVFAQSEVHVSSQNQLDTNFSEVHYEDSNQIWHLFDQGLWVEDSPYSVDKTEYYEFRNYGP